MILEDDMFHTIVSYFRLAFPVLYWIGAWRLGAWKNWRTYYPTILFIIGVDFLISILMYDYPLWTFHASLLIPNHTISDFWITFTVFPPMVIIFLSGYPYRSQWYKQALYIALWIIFQAAVESLIWRARLISYHHGWNFGWSSLVWMSLFIGLRLHHTRPLLAWLLCFLLTAFLILHFRIPVTKFR